jgi:hypothetical protein
VPATGEYSCSAQEPVLLAGSSHEDSSSPVELGATASGARRRPAPWRAAPGTRLAGVVLLCGCLGDQPPDPEVQSLEIVVGNADPEHGPCLLNVEEVGAGTHEVIPVSMGGSATVRIVDPSGAVLYERAVEEHRLEEEVTRCRRRIRERCASRVGTTASSACCPPARTPSSCSSSRRDPGTRAAPADAWDAPVTWARRAPTSSRPRTSRHLRLFCCPAGRGGAPGGGRRGLGSARTGAADRRRGRARPVRRLHRSSGPDAQT